MAAIPLAGPGPALRPRLTDFDRRRILIAAAAAAAVGAPVRVLAVRPAADSSSEWKRTSRKTVKSRPGASRRRAGETAPGEPAGEEVDS